MSYENHLTNYTKSFTSLNISDYIFSDSNSVDLKSLTPIATTVVALKYNNGVVWLETEGLLKEIILLMMTS